MGRDRHAAGESGNRNDGPAERWTPNTTLVRVGEAVGFDCHPVARVGERGNMCVGTPESTEHLYAASARASGPLKDKAPSLGGMFSYFWPCCSRH